MKEEMDPVVQNDTWKFVGCPKTVKVIENRWMLWTMVNADGLTISFAFDCSQKDMCKSWHLLQ
jgi:hypothetical protein